MEIIRRFKGKEILTVKIDSGECIQTVLEKVVEEEKTNAIVLTAIGTVSKVNFANPKPSLKKENVDINISEVLGPFELISLIGGLGPVHAHGKWKSHIHIAVSNHDGSILGGGLRYGTEAWFPVQVQLLLHD